jgi:hypothetical protein
MGGTGSCDWNHAFNDYVWLFCKSNRQIGFTVKEQPVRGRASRLITSKTGEHGLILLLRNNSPATVLPCGHEHTVGGVPSKNSVESEGAL